MARGDLSARVLNGQGSGSSAERRLQFGVHLFNLAQGVKDISLPLLLLFETGRPADIGIAFAIQQLPNLLLSPVAGVLVDRFDRRLILWFVTASRPILMLLLTVVVLVGFNLPLVCLLLFFLGVGDAVYDIALISYTADVAKSARLPVLNGRFAASEILFTRVVGVIAGSALYSWLGLWTFVLVAVAWLMSCIFFYLLPVVRQISVYEKEPVRLLDGFRLVWGDPVLRGLTLDSFVMNTSASAWWVLIPLLSIDGLGLPVPIYGFVLASAGLCGVVATWSGHRLGRLASPLVLLVGCVLVVALSGFAMGYAGGIWFFVVALCVFMVADSLWTVWSATVRQRRIPRAQLGVANGAYRTVGRGASPLGSFFGGVIAQDLGVTLPFGGTSAILVIAAVGVGVYWWWKGELCASA